MKENQLKAYLVGCGLGDPELLTLKAYKIITTVQVVLYDHLISDEIMALIPTNTVKIFVGKKKGFHSKAQEEINLLIKTQIDKGLSVARLKSGDPFIFGRGGEELLYLNQHNIETEVIAGISSSISAPLMANIPITSRGISNSFSVVSAHKREGIINLEWLSMLLIKEHTLIVLMGLSCIKEIVQEATKMKIDTNISCAIISNASRQNQSVLIGTLKNLEELSQKASRPAIIVFGDVVKFKKKLKKDKAWIF